MAFEIQSLIAGKRVLILGFGKEGRSTYRLLRAWFPDMHMCIADRDEAVLAASPELRSDRKLRLVGGNNYLEGCNDYDLVIKSPGLPYSEVIKKADAAKVTSQTDLFLRAFAGRVIGVTGTKGKSTVTSLIHHILSSAGRDAILAGNIGVPPLDIAGSIAGQAIVVFEMSSHQLEHISISPHTAVILNIFPEHLDHYKDFTAYKMAKFNIGRSQPEGGGLVYNADDPIIAELVAEQAVGKKLMSFSIDPEAGTDAIYDRGQIVYRDHAGLTHHMDLVDFDMPGNHNVMNMMAAVLVCMDRGLDAGQIMKGLSGYRRLPHRLENAGTYRGITFYDDSIATIPEASMAALKTLGHVDMLILGGYDRGLEYDSLCEWLCSNPVPVLAFMGDAGRRMSEEWKDKLPDTVTCTTVGSMQEAVELAAEMIRPGGVCLLSPAAASYGMFRNFEERGDVFRKLAAAL